MKKNLDSKIMLLVMILLIICMGVSKILNNNKKELITNKEINKQEFSMYVDDGSGYKEYKEDKFPQGYRLNIEQSECEDSQGNKITPLEGILSEDNLKITIKSNKTIYCRLYFDKVEIPDNYIFYIKEESNSPKYTNTDTNTVYIKHDIEYITHYCLTEEDTSKNCTWVETNDSKDMEVPYTFKNKTNEEKKVRLYLKNKYEVISKVKEDKIIYDTTPPVVEYSLQGGIYNANKTITITVKDENGISGWSVHSHLHGVNDGTVPDWNKSKDNITDTTSFEVSITEGTWTIYVYVTDKAGNAQTQTPFNDYNWYYQTYTIDTLAPTCGTINKTATGESGVTGTIGCTDNTSGCVQTSYSFTSLKSNGTVTIKDKAGNQINCTIPVSSKTVYDKSTRTCGTQATTTCYRSITEYCCPGSSGPDCNRDASRICNGETQSIPGFSPDGPVVLCMTSNEGAKLDVGGGLSAPLTNCSCQADSLTEMFKCTLQYKAAAKAGSEPYSCPDNTRCASWNGWSTSRVDTCQASSSGTSETTCTPKTLYS